MLGMQSCTSSSGRVQFAPFHTSPAMPRFPLSTAPVMQSACRHAGWMLLQQMHMHEMSHWHMQVLKQTETWCPNPARLQLDQARLLPEAERNPLRDPSPQWGWDPLVRSRGDSLRPASEPLLLHALAHCPIAQRVVCHLTLRQFQKKATADAIYQINSACFMSWFALVSTQQWYVL